VLSGTRRATRSVTKLIVEQGGAAVRLGIGGAFHSSLMRSAVEPFRRYLASTDLREPAIPWLSTIDCQVHRDPERIRALLVAALVSPVRWMDAIGKLAALDVSVIVDVGPGDRLARLVSSSVRTTPRPLAGAPAD